MAFKRELADKWCKFFENVLTHSKGKYQSQHFQLIPWQRKLVREVFGTVNRDGNRQYRTAYLEIPKKNGKTELGAGIGLGALILDDEPGAEIYCVAASRDQAGILFRVAMSMVRNNPILSGLVEVLESTKTMFLKEHPDRVLRVLSSDATTGDGVNPHVVLFDELHRQKKSDLWDVFEYGDIIREQPLIFAMTTAGVYGESPLCWEQHEYARQVREGVIHDPSYYAAMYALPEDWDWTKEGTPGRRGKAPTGWYAANPSLGYFMPVAKVRDEVQKALAAPSKQNRLLRFRFNRWTQQTERWLPMDAWDRCGEPFNPSDLLGKSCYVGIDLSATRDITAVVLLFPWEHGTHRVLCRFWLPEEGLDERVKRDRVPYDVWVKEGLITLTPGNVVDYAFIRKALADLASLYEIKEVGHDPWNALQLATELAEDGFQMVPIRQGYGSLSAPAKALEAGVMNQTIQHGGNAVLRWMADCTSVSQDPAGNIKPVKPDRKSSNKRIDGIVALVISLARAIVQPEYKESVYRHRGIIVLGADS